MATGTQILEQRANQYGSFKGNMTIVSILKKTIFITDVNGNATWLHDDWMSSTVEFIRNMLALKAARSTMAAGATLDDCIVDFINYYNLVVEATDFKLRFEWDEAVWAHEVYTYLTGGLLVDEEAEVMFREGGRVLSYGALKHYKEIMSK